MYIYKAVNNINGKIYIGLQTHERVNYIGSGVLIKKAIKKYGRSNFIKTIIERCEDLVLLNEREQFWIKEYNCIQPNGYNISKGGGNREHLRTPVDHHILDSIENLYNNGKTLTYISQLTGLSLTKIQNELKNKNIKLEKRKITNKQKAAYSLKYTKNPEDYIPIEKHKNALDLFNKGLTYKKISTSINEPLNNIINFFKKLKLKRKKLAGNTKVGKYNKLGSNNPNYKKIEESLVISIVDDFTSKNLKIAELSNKYNIPYKRIRRVLVENNLKIKKGPRCN